MTDSESSVDAFISEEALLRIARLLEAGKGIDISSFKDNYLKRRVYLRATALHCPNIETYCDHLQNNPEELKVLENALTVNVSYFFRNPEVFQLISNTIVPELVEKKTKRGETFLKILSIGCASGEEPYSIAIMMKDYFSKHPATVTPYIMGIDLDYGSIVSARLGVYDEQKLIYLPEGYRKKYFTPRLQGDFSLIEDIKKMVVLRHEDIFRKDIKKYWDIVFCRNMLIYLNSESQEELLDKVVSVCVEGSYLVLGKSESLSVKRRNFFYPAYPKERIYLIKRRSYYED